MKKQRLLLLILAVLCTCFTCVSLTACVKQPTEHSFTLTERVESTCTEAGYERYTCADCGEEKTEPLPLAGHKEIPHGAKAPTCEEIGWEAYVTCENCDYTTYAELPATGEHRWDEGEITKTPTCDTPGERTYTCSDCKTATKAEEIKAEGHSYGKEWSYNETHHYRLCACGDRADLAEHISSGEATATQDSVCTECGYVLCKAAGVVFGSLTFTDGLLSLRVSSGEECFSLAGEITVVGEATYVLSWDEKGNSAIEGEIVPLKAGQNIFFLTVTALERKTVYRFAVYRKHIYTVTFDTSGGTEIPPQQVEEGDFATAPENVELAGYTLLGWSYDFSEPITENTEIGALWLRNPDTPYTVSYYLQALDGSYELEETRKGKGETDSEVSAEIKEYVGFTYQAEQSTASGNIAGNGGLVLSLYYDRNEYSVTVSDPAMGEATASAKMLYGATVTLTATPNEGYTFTGWQKDGALLSDSATYPYTVTGDITATFKEEDKPLLEIVQDGEGFILKKVNDKSVTELVIPDYITAIQVGALSGLSKLESLTLPFVGAAKVYAYGSAASQYTLLGCIFGTSSYTGSYGANQYYKGDSYKTYYLPSSLKRVTVLGGNIHYGAFDRCTSLTEIVLSDAIPGVGSCAFRYCSSLQRVAVGSAVAEIGEIAFYGCDALENIDVAERNAVYRSIGGNLYSKNGKTLIQYAIGKKEASFTVPVGVQKLGYQAFANSKSLAEVVLSDTVTEIDGWAFLSCYALARVDLGKGVTLINDRAFNDCTALTSLFIPESVKHIYYRAFYGCKSLSSLTFEDPSGWYRTNSHPDWENRKNGTRTDFSDAARNVGYFNKTYKDYLWYQADTYAYTVNYYRQKEESNEYLLYEALSGKAEAGTLISAEIREYEGFAYAEALSQAEGTVTAEGLTLNLYYDREIEDVLIIETVNGTVTVTGVKDPSLTHAEIPDHVTAIGDNAFENCTSLVSVSMPYRLTAIGAYAFSGCSSLAGMSIPEGVTYIGHHAFYQCVSLTEIFLPKSVTSLGYTAFWGCKGLKRAVVAENLAAIPDSLFSYCTSLEEITLPDSLISIGENAFIGCTSLTELIIPRSVIYIKRNAFHGCTSLVRMYLDEPRNWYHIDSATSMENRVYGTLTDLSNAEANADYFTQSGWYSREYWYKIPVWGYTVLYYLQGEQEGEYEIAAERTGELLEGYNVEAEILTFEGYELNSERSTLNGKSAEGLTLFVYYDKTEQIDPNLILGYVMGELAVKGLYDKTVTSVTIPSTVTAIGDWAFQNCVNLTSVTVPVTVTKLGKGAFYGCTGLKEVVMRGGISAVGEAAFYGCTSLAGVSLPETVSLIGSDAFGNCESLVGITLPASVTTVGDNAFKGCTALSRITLPEGLNAIGSYAFDGCDALTSVVFPNTLRSIGECAFRSCSLLGSAVLPEGMAVLEYHVFSYCSNLKTLVIPNTVKVIREMAFYACSSLTEITIPDSVTTVERDAFGFCRSAKTISIGAGVATLGEMAFYRCFAVEQFVVSEANAAYRSISGNLYSKDGKTLLQYAIGKTDAYFVVPEGVTAIGVYAFDKAVHLLRVEIPKSVISVSGYVFEGCDALTDIVFADPTGWYAASSYADWQAQNGTYTDLSDSSYAASYIKEWYYKYWFKKV